MVAPRKKDYSAVTPLVIEKYRELRNITKVAKQFRISPTTVKRILDDNHVTVGQSGIQNHSRKRVPFQEGCCAFCHKYSRTTTVTGYCMTLRRTVAGKDIEPCFVK